MLPPAFGLRVLHCREQFGVMTHAQLT